MQAALACEARYRRQMERCAVGQHQYNAEDVQQAVDPYDAGPMVWFLAAMNYHRLKQRDKALDAFCQGDAAVAELKRQAEDHPNLRLQFESLRPSIDALRKEADDLLKGKDPANRATG